LKKIHTLIFLQTFAPKHSECDDPSAVDWVRGKLADTIQPKAFSINSRVKKNPAKFPLDLTQASEILIRFGEILRVEEIG